MCVRQYSLLVSMSYQQNKIKNKQAAFCEFDISLFVESKIYITDHPEWDLHSSCGGMGISN